MDESQKRERRACDLQTIQDVKDWLHRPENQVRTALYVIKWDGATPYIAVAPTNRLLELDQDDALAACVLYEHHRRRFRVSSDDGENNEGEQAE